MSAGRYQIRLKGHLGPRWAARFDGMTLTARADPGIVLFDEPVNGSTPTASAGSATSSGTSPPRDARCSSPAT